MKHTFLFALVGLLWLGCSDAKTGPATDTTGSTIDTTASQADTIIVDVPVKTDIALDSQAVADTLKDSTEPQPDGLGTDTLPTPDADTLPAPDTTIVADSTAAPDTMPGPDTTPPVDTTPIPDTAPTPDTQPPVDTMPQPDATPSDVPVDECAQLDPTTVYPPNLAGCADGTREGFLNANKITLLAACGGAWTVPGIHETVPACNHEAGNTGANAMGIGCSVADLCAPGWHVCLGKTDVDAHNPEGCAGIMDCAVSPAFFLARTSSTGAFNCAPDTIGQPQSLNDLFGCGDLGCPATQQTCAPLTLGSHDKCKSLKNKPTASCECFFAGELPPNDPKYVDGDMETVVCSPNSGGCGWCKPLDYWSKKLGTPFADNWDCGINTTKEAANVTKTDPYTQGGVLCCKTF
jgi:hypothetical protein